jgi:hypothetical protein
MSSHDLPRDLRAAYAASPDCVAPERLLAAVLGELTEAERQAVEAHAALCPACSAELELARAFAPSASELAAGRADLEPIIARLRRANPAAPPAARVLPFEKPAARRLFAPATRRFALAATLLVAAGALFLLGRGGDRAPGLPTPPESEVVRSARLEAIAPQGELATVPTSFSWRAIADAKRYRVHLLGVDDEVLWQGESAGTELPLPADLRARLAPAVHFRWRIEATAANGDVLARSETVEFVISPPPPRP